MPPLEPKPKPKSKSPDRAKPPDRARALASVGTPIQAATAPVEPDTADAPDKEQRAVQSVEVGGRLLLALANSPGPLVLRELAALADLSPSRAHPYLVSFGRLGLIEQNPSTGHYGLGPAALRMGLTCLYQSDPIVAAMPVAQSLAEATGHAVAVAVWGNFGPTVVRMFEARQPLHVAMRAGTVMSILGTATGRAFAAVLPRETLEQAMRGPLGELSEAAAGTGPVDLGRSMQEIATDVARHGVARAVGRPIPGVNAFSAAAFDHEGHPAIVITALGHQDRFPSTWDSPIAAQVRRAAADITVRLGGPAPRAGRQ